MRIPSRPRSLWIATAPGRPFPRLRQDVARFDVDGSVIDGPAVKPLAPRRRDRG